MDIGDFDSDEDDKKPKRAPRFGKAKGGRPAGELATNKFKNADIAVSLVKNSGVLILVAKDMGMSRESLVKRIDRHPYLQEIMAEIDAKILDIAEGKLFEALGKGDMATIRWYLERKGKSRGYATKIDQDLSAETVTAVAKELRSQGLDALRAARDALAEGKVLPFKADRA